MGSLLLLALPFPWKDPAPSKARQDLGGIFQFTCTCSLLQCHTIIPTHKAFFYIVTIPFLKKQICALWTQFCHLPPDTRRSNRLSDSRGWGGAPEDRLYSGAVCARTLLPPQPRGSPVACSHLAFVLLFFLQKRKRTFFFIATE